MRRSLEFVKKQEGSKKKKTILDRGINGKAMNLKECLAKRSLGIDRRSSEGSINNQTNLKTDPTNMLNLTKKIEILSRNGD